MNRMWRASLCSAIGLLTLLFWSAVQAEQAGPMVAVSLDARLANYNATELVSGQVRIQGSETMLPLMQRLAAEFRRRQPQVTIDLKGGGSMKAIEAFLQPPLKSTGKIRLKEERGTPPLIVAASRPLARMEIEQFTAQHGYAPLTLAVAVDAVAIYVHKDNPVEGLTLGEVDAIFSATRHRGMEQIRRWEQVGLGSNWTGSPIRLYGRDRRSGTRNFFQEHVLIGGEFSSAIQEEPGAASLILALSRDPLGIGYNGLGLQTSTVRVVPLADAAGHPFVIPSATSVADETYPLRRLLYLHVDKSPEEPLSGCIAELVRFVTSREGQEAVVRAGFFPLPMSEVDKSQVAVKHSPNERLSTP
jgi:phosphate transport system substrate-binding protein